MLTLYKPAGLTVELIDVAVEPPQEFPPTMADVPDQQLTVGVAFALGLGGFVTRTEGDAVTFEVVGALPPGVALDALTGDIVGTPTTPGSYTVAVADKYLGRNLAGGSDGGRMVKDALRSLRNKTSIAGGTLTVCEEDDVTPAWTAAVTTTAGDPLSAIDPA